MGEPKTMIGILGQAPEVAAALGGYVSAVSALEGALNLLLDELLGTTEQMMAIVIFGHLESIGKRVDILEDVAERANLSDEKSKAIATFLAATRKINTRRNTLLHGLWMVESETKTVTLSHAGWSARRKAGEEVVTAEGLKNETTEVMRTYSAVFAVVMPQRVKPV